MSVTVHPDGRAIAIIAGFSIAAVVTTVVNLLRVYVRVHVIKGQHTFYEDLTAGVGWLLLMCLCGLAIAGTFFGTGRPFIRIPLQNLEEILKITWWYDITYLFAQMSIKHSITLMLLRYAVDEYHKKIIYIVTFAVHAISMVVLALFIFQCIPLSFFWTRGAGYTNGRCMDVEIGVGAAYAYSAILVAYDFTMALLPWLMVRKLQLDLRTRLMVTVVLALGSVACIVTIVRIPYIIVLAHTQQPDVVAILDMVSCSEMALSIAASSASTLKPLFRRGSAQSDSNRSGRTPVLNTFKSSPAGSSAGSSARECNVEFSTAFFGAEK